MSDAALRPARPEEAGEVSALALRSKGHWGYSSEFLDACGAELTYAEADLRTGSCGPCSSTQGAGTGLGGLLLRDALTWASERGFTSLVLDADPGAEGFYAHSGARRVGEVASGSIPGRLLPRMEFTLAPSPDRPPERLDVELVRIGRPWRAAPVLDPAAPCFSARAQLDESVSWWTESNFPSRRVQKCAKAARRGFPVRRAVPT